MSSMFEFPIVITQNDMPDDACSMTHHTDSMIACARLTLKTQIPFEILNHQTNHYERLKLPRGKGRARLWQIFCTICAQVSIVCCKPLQVVALKIKVYCLYSLTLCQRRGCPACCFLCNASCLQLATLLQNLDTTFHSCAVLPQSLGLPGYPSLVRSSPAQVTIVACVFTSFTVTVALA